MPILDDICIVKKTGKALPIYEQIHHYLKDHILSGHTKPGQRLPSPTYIVNKWSVGYQAVKTAFQLLEKDGFIKCEPGRGKGPIVAACKKPLVAGSMTFVSWTRESEEHKVKQGLLRFAKENNSELHIVDASDSFDHFIGALQHTGENGVVVFPPEHPRCRKAIERLVSSGAHLVFVDRFLKGLSVSSVSVDHVDGAYRATIHLLETHNQPVYFAGNTTDPTSARDRLHGWSSAMHDYNYYELDPYIWSVPFHDAQLATQGIQSYLQFHYEKMVEYLKGYKEDRCYVFAMNDLTAKCIYKAADELGYKIGEDIFVIGFGDLPLCRQLSVPLSSIVSDFETVGYEAAKLLKLSMQGNIKQPIHKKIPVELIVRESSVKKH